MYRVEVYLRVRRAVMAERMSIREETRVFGSERLSGALVDRLTHRVHLLEMNGDSYRLPRSRDNATSRASEGPLDSSLTTGLLQLPLFGPNLPTQRCLSLATGGTNLLRPNGPIPTPLTEIRAMSPILRLGATV